jgi:hypothetical protein
MSATTFTDNTPGRVTEALNGAGHLQRGSVTRVVSQLLSDVPFGAPKLRKLEITYSADAACQVPEHLILKIAKKEKEYFFYTQIAIWMEIPPIPECYFAAQNADKSQATFLLEDLSATHFQTEWPVPLHNRFVRLRSTAWQLSTYSGRTIRALKQNCAQK